MNVMVSITQQIAPLFSPYRVAIFEGNIPKYSSLLTRSVHTTVHLPSTKRFIYLEKLL
jgi:hypothetical protein